MNVHSPREHTADVLIVGAGPLGWACAQLLSRKKISTIVVDPALNHHRPQWLQHGLGVFWPSLNDPPTRSVVAHGHDMACWLQEYCRQGLNHTSDVFKDASLQTIRTVRLGILKHEVDELNQAFALGLGLREPAVLPQVSIFDETTHARWLTQNPQLTQDSSTKKYLNLLEDQVLSIDEMNDHCRAQLGSNESIRSEMVILAAGYKITTFAPWLKNMLIPMSDVQSVWTTNLSCADDAAPVAIRASSGHVAAVFYPEQNPLGSRTWSIKMTGPRFLLPQAGAGLDLSNKPVEASLIMNIENWLKTHLLPALQPVLDSNAVDQATLQCIHTEFGVDCLPCDELPMLGDLGQQGRLLGSTGWLGCGWSASLQSASILCEIVEQGRSERLAPLLRPRRWRTGWDESGVTGMT